MNRLTVRQQNHPQIAVLHLWHLDPAPDSSVALDHLSNRAPYGTFDPFVPNQSSIRSLTDRSKVPRNLHAVSVSDHAPVRLAA